MGGSRERMPKGEEGILNGGGYDGIGNQDDSGRGCKGQRKKDGGRGKRVDWQVDGGGRRRSYILLF